MTVTEYEREFIRLSKYAQEYVSTEEIMCKRFVDGLNEDIKLLVGVLELEEFVVLVDRACKAEENNEIIRIESDESSELSVTISFMSAQKCVRKGCEAYLAYVLDTKVSESKIESVPIVYKYPDVVPEELSGQLKQHEGNYPAHDLELAVICFTLKIWRRRICVPKDVELRKSILQEAHSSSYAMHHGDNKMYSNLCDLYWWSGLKHEVTKFVSHCLMCQQVKAKHQLPSRLLQTIKIPL
ncbi:Retrovirus-related Pol polyprotein from transposon 297 family [Gossypium australe]|uniref:Retrovirus-related Pol polyprotein from transposon 297 family n=1 Tax=Gossypium australe TaxID=47621 RepID=A0A5B6WRZ3_9ROSI|nr:Retrovirus-related Pol polyprotein from transposon 297 family [Gossypium australe]